MAFEIINLLTCLLTYFLTIEHLTLTGNPMLELVEPTGQRGLINTGSGQNGLDFDSVTYL